MFGVPCPPREILAKPVCEQEEVVPLNTYREAHYETEGVKRTTVKTACCYPPFQRLNLMFKLLVNLPEHINQLREVSR